MPISRGKSLITSWGSLLPFGLWASPAFFLSVPQKASILQGLIRKSPVPQGIWLSPKFKTEDNRGTALVAGAG